MKYYIYKITNNLTGKIYVGRTNKTLEKRFQKHKQDAYRGVDTYFYRAIRKYKIENFKIELIDTIDSIDNAIVKESFYIDSLNSFRPNGYNTTKMTDGGLVDSPEVKLKKRKAQQGARVIGARKYTGVSKNRKCKTYNASVQFENKQIAVCCDTEIEAAESYDKLVLFIYGKDARLNFPNKRESYLNENLEEFFNKSKNKKVLNRYLCVVAMYGKFYIRARDKKTNKWEILGKYLTKDEACGKLVEIRKQDYEYNSFLRY